MCLLCGGAGAHAVSIAERPPLRLGGLRWSGSYGDAATGAIRTLLGAVQDFSARRAGMWKSPLVGLSRNGRGDDGFDYFAGVAIDDGETLPDGFVTVDVPAMTVAASWHGEGDGDVVAHYGRMLEWLRGSGYARDRASFDHCEEYPHDADLDATPTLRLFLPVVRERAAPRAGG